jgi:hypothetical protein
MEPKVLEKLQICDIHSKEHTELMIRIVELLSSIDTQIKGLEESITAAHKRIENGNQVH